MRPPVQPRPNALQCHALNVTVHSMGVLSSCMHGQCDTCTVSIPCDADAVVPTLQMAGKTSGKISTLVISPTRELASQIAVEAEALGRFHNITVQVNRLLMSMTVVFSSLCWTQKLLTSLMICRLFAFCCNTHQRALA